MFCRGAGIIPARLFFTEPLNVPKQSVLLCLSLLVAAVFYGLVAHFAVNIPQQDDYDSILFYLLGSRENFSNGLFDLHVSHRLAFTRLLAGATLLTGQGVDFRLLIFAGSLCLTGAVFLLYRSLRGQADRSLLLLLCLCVFSLFHWSNMAWATAAIQNYASLLAAVVCFYLYNRETPTSRALAITVALAAPYINSNGLLLLPLLSWWTVTGSGHRQQRRITTGVLVAACLVSFTVYFFLLPTRPGTVLPELVTEPTFPTLAQVATGYLIACAGYLHFAPLALLGGLFLNGCFLFLAASGYGEKNRVVFYTLLFLLMSMMLVALYRYELGTRQLIASRYQVYTLLIAGLAAVSALQSGIDRRLGIRQARLGLLLAFAALYLASFYYLGNLHSERARLIDGIRSWQSNGGSALHYPDPEHAAALLDRAIRNSLYRLPAESRR